MGLGINALDFLPLTLRCKGVVEQVNVLAVIVRNPQFPAAAAGAAGVEFRGTGRPAAGWVAG